jgi:hypothetical protein
MQTRSSTGTEPLKQATGKMTITGGLEKSGFAIEIS